MDPSYEYSNSHSGIYCRFIHMYTIRMPVGRRGECGQTYSILDINRNITDSAGFIQQKNIFEKSVLNVQSSR